MLLESMHVLLGLAIALFHVHLADFIREQDLALCAAFRERGINFPDALSEQASRNLFFCFGIAIALFSLTRIWLSLH
jgi:hypothetical protein